MEAKYTTEDMQRLASDRGPFAADKMRSALLWAARVLEAADRAVTAERERAEGLHADAVLLRRSLGECSGALECARHPIEWQRKIDEAVAAERERCIEAVEGNLDGSSYALPERIAAMIVARIRGANA